MVVSSATLPRETKRAIGRISCGLKDSNHLILLPLTPLPARNIVLQVDTAILGIFLRGLGYQTNHSVRERLSVMIAAATQKGAVLSLICSLPLPATHPHPLSSSSSNNVNGRAQRSDILRGREVCNVRSLPVPSSGLKSSPFMCGMNAI